MNCDVCRRQLLTSENPRYPGSEVDAHLAECPSCREFQKQLVRIEANVFRLPIPAADADAKARMLDRLQHAPAPAPRVLPFRQKQRRLLFYAGSSVAAAVVLIVAGILFSDLLSRHGRHDTVAEKTQPGPADNGQKNAPAPAPKLVNRLLNCDLRLAEADTAKQRVESLADLAQQLTSETRTLAAVAEREDLDALAKMYGQVVREGVLARARALPAAERRPVLEPILDRLAQDGRDIEELARQAPAHTAAPLQHIADTARHGDAQLRALMKEDA